MKVTQPMIDRAVKTLAAAQMEDSIEKIAENVLRAALNDPKKTPEPIPGQMSVDDYPEAFA